MITREDIIGLYIALFGRAPEGNGLDNWYNLAVNNNLNLSQLANSMVNAAVQVINSNDFYKMIYPQYMNINLSDYFSIRDIVETVYKNIFNKDYNSDPEGIDGWVNAVLNGNMDIGSAVVSIIEAALNTDWSYDPTAFKAYKTFLNRINVAKYIADHIEEFDGDFYKFRKYIYEVNDRDESIQSVKMDLFVDKINTEGIDLKYADPNIRINEYRIEVYLDPGGAIVFGHTFLGLRSDNNKDIFVGFEKNENYNFLGLDNPNTYSGQVRDETLPVYKKGFIRALKQGPIFEYPLLGPKEFNKIKNYIDNFKADYSLLDSKFDGNNYNYDGKYNCLTFVDHILDKIGANLNLEEITTPLEMKGWFKKEFNSRELIVEVKNTSNLTFADGFNASYTGRNDDDYLYASGDKINDSVTLDATLENEGFSDYIMALDGNDYVFAFEGNDYIDGGEGNDILVGGMGNDTYVFNFTNDTYTNPEVDRILDYDGINTLILKTDEDDIVIKQLLNNNSDEGIFVFDNLETNSPKGIIIIEDFNNDYGINMYIEDYTNADSINLSEDSVYFLLEEYLN